VRSEGRCAWFETKLLNEKPALVSLTESLNDEAALLERLRAAAKVRHVNVAAILQSGTTRLQDTPLVYAVMEYTEENLEDVLRARSLSAEETKQVAESLTSALEAIHKERLACGRLEPASVLAAGDTIKLRSDHLQIVPQESSMSVAAAKDVQGLGAVLYQCLTQRRPKMDGNDPSIQLLPPPFVQVARRALGGQATVAEIVALLRPASTAPRVAPPVVATVVPPVAAAKPEPEKAIPVNTPNIPKKPVPVKPVIAQETLPLIDDEPMVEVESQRMYWIIGAVVVLLALIGLAVHGLRHAPQPTAPAPAPARSEAPPAAQPPAVASKPAAAAPAMTPKSAPAATETPAEGSGTWRVVAFTYNHQDQAQHKAETINAKHPELQAGVFSPKSNRAPYLVTLGGPMERVGAFQLRSKAIRQGLPHDTYAQNYSH